MFKELFSVILVETISGCNRNCWFCKFGQRRYLENRSNPEKLDFDIVKKIVYNLKKLHFKGRINWHRINEPLLDDRICEIIQFTRSELSDVNITLITNGELLDQRKYNDLVKSGLDHLTISVYSNEVFNKISSLDLIDFRIKDYRPKNIHNVKLLNQGGSIKQLGVKKDYQSTNCLRPFTAINICSNGDVVLCCSDIFGDVKVGNILNENLEDIWFGSKMKEVRRELQISRERLQLCSKCNHDGSGHGVNGEKIVEI